MVQFNTRIPKGARDYLLQLAIEHNAFVTRKGVRQPSIQTLLRLMASGSVKTVKGHEILDEIPAIPYPMSKGKGNLKEMEIKKRESEQTYY